MFSKKLYIILITLIIFSIFFLKTKEKFIENMTSCSLDKKNLLENPLFLDLKKIGNNKFYDYIIDFKNNVIDNKILLSDLLNINSIIKLQVLLNSYSAFDPINNLIITGNTTLFEVKNYILKTIILNHLTCFGESDVNLFWIKLHLIDKELKPIDKKLEKDPLVEMFDNSNNEIDGYDYEQIKNFKIISYNKHLENISQYLIEKHPILKNIINDFNLIYENNLHQIILNLLNYLVNNEIKDKNIFKEIKNLYIDLRELILINQLMSKNPDYQFGYSENEKIFVLNHKLFLDNFEKMYNKIIQEQNTFDKLFSNYLISKEKKNISKIFLAKLEKYFIYNGIKILGKDDYLFLNINSVNLKDLNEPINYQSTINPEYISLLNFHYKINDNEKNKEFSFRIKRLPIAKQINES